MRTQGHHGPLPIHTRSLVSLFINIQSLAWKQDKLSSFLEDADSDIVVLTETWLHPDISNNELFFFASTYNMYRCDRLNRWGGGVLVAIKKIFTSHCISLGSTLEIIWTVSKTCSMKVLVGACYCPLDSNGHFIIDLHDSISNALKACQADMVYLLGDFNLSHIEWAKWTWPCQIASDFVNLILDFNSLSTTHPQM